ncbi:hypothetical protein BC943DRAFT_326051 [Umbelopsis sp. AD052]|nr:hypothetical protein BC943DRAFT_326051 [Umbelopsis sp. AD052]
MHRTMRPKIILTGTTDKVGLEVLKHLLHLVPASDIIWITQLLSPKLKIDIAFQKVSDEEYLKRYVDKQDVAIWRSGYR